MTEERTIKEQFSKLSEEQIGFILKEFDFERKDLDSFNENVLEKIYYALGDIEVSELMEDDENVSERGKMASEIIDILGEIYVIEDDED